MKFNIVYYCNPVKPHNISPKLLNKGDTMINRGVHNLGMKIMHPSSKFNADRNAKRIIRGFSIIYGFRPQKFINDNFKHARKHYYIGSYKITPAMWIIIIKNLKKELLSVRHCSYISKLMQSRYHKYIRISNIQQYYHPRKQHMAKNIRSNLAKLSPHKRYLFTGVFIRIGIKAYHGHYKLTVLLINIKHGSHLMTNHVWLNFTKSLQNLGQLRAGNRISFKARVKPYLKGYIPDTFTKKMDYELSYPSDVHVLNVNPHLIKKLPKSHNALIGYAVIHSNLPYNDGNHPYLKRCVHAFKSNK